MLDYRHEPPPLAYIKSISVFLNQLWQLGTAKNVPLPRVFVCFVWNDGIVPFITLGCLILLFLPDGPQLIITPHAEAGSVTSKPPQPGASRPVQHRLAHDGNLAASLQRAGVHFTVGTIPAAVGLGFVDIPNGDDFALGAVMGHGDIYSAISECYELNRDNILHFTKKGT
ncbi:hypothetical protein AAY473_019551 [Plecturocebus cupreus]